MTYYVWSGVGAIQDFDGEDLPHALNRTQAILIFKEFVEKQNHKSDWTLWERDGQKARLIRFFIQDWSN